MSYEHALFLCDETFWSYGVYYISLIIKISSFFLGLAGSLWNASDLFFVFIVFAFCWFVRFHFRSLKSF